MAYGLAWVDGKKKAEEAAQLMKDNDLLAKAKIETRPPAVAQP